MDNKRKKMKEPARIGDIIDNVLHSFGRNSEMRMVEVWRLWDRIVEKPVAENTRPAAFRKKLLLVHVSSSSWIQQLQFMKEDIIEKVNIALGEDLIEEIKFKIGPV